jgi:hypothetical protein
MIQFDRYDACDKWQLLCRYWQDRGAPPDIGLDRLGRPWLPRWDRAAARAGAAACSDYIRLKAASLQQAAAVEQAPDATAVNREIARMLQVIGYAELQRRVRQLAEAIPARGFLASAEDELAPLIVERLREVFKADALGALGWTEDPDEIPDLAVLRQQAAFFPTGAIKGKRNVLCLFCANFYGRSDVIHVHGAAPDSVTLVDNDAVRIERMKRIYPADWTFFCGDYREFLQQAAAAERRFDLVVADPPRAMIAEVAVDALAPIVQLCSETIIVNFLKEMCDELGAAPDDLEALSRVVERRSGVAVSFVELLPRGPDIYWAVMRTR